MAPTSAFLSVFASLAIAAAPGKPASAPSGSAAAAKSSPPPSSPPAPAKRELVRRTLKITDANADAIPALRVAHGAATTLVFATPIKDGGALLADINDLFYPPQLTDRTILLVPKKDPGAQVTSLTVTLADGTILPFQLVAAQGETDLQVDVVVALEKAASPESPQALKGALAQLRGQLDECQASAGSAGIAKVAALIISQDLDKPQAYIVERRAVHHLDKQSRLLVESRHLYRLFGFTYMVLTIQNRDPGKTWVLDRPEVRVAGGGEASDVKVVTHQIDLEAVPPDEIAKLVLVYATPAQQVGQKLTVELREKNGNRHVKLEGLDL